MDIATRRAAILAGLLTFLAAGGACGPDPVRSANAVPADISLEADLARGGRLYDKWFAEIGAEVPKAAHAAYPASGGRADEPHSTWRCKECHGWDFAGRDGAYANGSHATGIVGIRASEGADVDGLVALLKAEPHGYGAVLGDRELHDLALFVSSGQFDMDAVIDRATRKPAGDAARGDVYYRTICAGCHGADGRVEDMPVLGKAASDNPWETLNKLLNGQPASAMPALRPLDRQVSLDILTYLQTLPQER